MHCTFWRPAYLAMHDPEAGRAKPPLGAVFLPRHLSQLHSGSRSLELQQVLCDDRVSDIGLDCAPLEVSALRGAFSSRKKCYLFMDLKIFSTGALVRCSARMASSTRKLVTANGVIYKSPRVLTPRSSKLFLPPDRASCSYGTPSAGELLLLSVTPSNGLVALTLPTVSF